ncbi:MAG: hypothetical protein JXA41_05905 [Deltaproteobacteria bacterium]|nr:hypothetical protein [Deltaproteobacteria bacterium]
MSIINTVLGPISSDDLGLTLAHEHIIAGYPGWDCDPLARPYDKDKIVSFCLCVMAPIKDYGVSTITEDEKLRIPHRSMVNIFQNIIPALKDAEPRMNRLKP